MSRIWKKGDFFVWLTGAALAICLIMVAGLLYIVACNGLGFFWPGVPVLFKLKSGGEVLGEIVEYDASGPAGASYKIKCGNRDLFGQEFAWVPESDVVAMEPSADAVVIERLEWGNFYGTIKEVRDGRKVAAGSEAWPALKALHPAARAVYDEIKTIEKNEIGALNDQIEKSRLRLKKLGIRGRAASPEADAQKKEIENRNAEFAGIEKRLESLQARLTASVVMVAADGREKEIALQQIVRYYQPVRWTEGERIRFFAIKLWEFFSEDPRESNSEGGIFPAVYGTVMMVFIMSAFVTPLGVLAALYLREYAGRGLFVNIVRIAVNNLAGVPSIVFGVFGVGFFIYVIGGSIDRVFYPESLPTPTFGTGGILWASLTLALLTVPVVIVATEEGLAAVPRSLREASLALGATQLETILKVVLPAVMPSILTGMILAMARAAGEVAPLMITGVVKLAPSLPLDSRFPFFHPERKFMHLGFHIYDVGFQSPNVDAAQPMVFATTLILILIVLLLNLAAIALRTRLRRKLSVSAI